MMIVYAALSSSTRWLWLAYHSIHQICHVISTMSVGRRRPHCIWFNRPGELPRHHVLYILTLVVFGVSMVGCMVTRDVHYVDGTLMHSSWWGRIMTISVIVDIEKSFLFQTHLPLQMCSSSDGLVETYRGFAWNGVLTSIWPTSY